MVEMLGVLAVAGVLSIGALSAYTYGMNKYRANEISENVSRMAFIASSQLLTGRDISLQEFDTDGSGVKIMGAYPVEGVAYDDDTFGLRVSGISDSVCEKIDQKEWNALVDLLINEDDICQDDNNTMEFIFANNMGQHEGCLGGFTGENCDEKISCENGGTWTPGGCECAEGWYGPKCDSDCDGVKRSDGLCLACNAKSSFETIKEECDKCSNWVYAYDTGKCSNCSLPQAFLSTKKECDKCPDREYNGNYCMPTQKECNENQFLRQGENYNSCIGCVAATREECIQCEKKGYYYNEDIPKCAKVCISGEFQLTNGTCVDCSKGSSITYTGGVNFCSMCDGTAYPRFIDNNGNVYRTCYPCSTTDSVSASPTECAKCGSQRVYDEATGKCNLAS